MLRRLVGQGTQIIVYDIWNMVSNDMVALDEIIALFVCRYGVGNL